MGQLCEDILFEILARLPVKSLVRFKCVCDRWKSLITSPQFVEAHLKISMQEASSRLWFLFDYLGSPSISVNFQRWVEANEEDININEISPERVPWSMGTCGSCNGLIFSHSYEEGVILWNPSAREVREMPQAPRNLSGSSGGWIVNGLGYDSLTDDYKYITTKVPPLSHLYTGGAVIGEITVDLFSLKSNSWRSVRYELEISCFDCVKTGIYCHTGVYFSGSLHWLVTSPSGSRAITSFNLAEEEFCYAIEMPSVDKNLFARSLCVYRECLVVMYVDSVKSQYEAWMMKEYGEMSSWTKLYSFSVPESKYCRNVLYITKAGEVVAMNRRREFCIFKPVKNTKGSIFCELPRISRYSPLHPPIPYVESLVSPYGVR